MIVGDFVDASQTFSDIFNPWPLDEDLEVGPVTGDSNDNNLIAVKIGDVSGDAKTNLKQTLTSSIRTGNEVGFLYENENVKKGNTVSVPIVADEDMLLYGYQFTLETDGIEIKSIQEGLLDMKNENVGFLDNNLITVSFADPDAIKVNKGDILFTLIGQVKESGILSEMIKVSGKITANEIYIGESLEIGEIQLIPNAESEQEVYVNALYQNEPNPFRKKTTIGYELEKEGDVTISIFDATGTILKVIHTYGQVGLNKEILNANDFKKTGLYYYELEIDGFTDIKKMIIVK